MIETVVQNDMDDLASITREHGGIDEMEIKEIEKSDLKKDFLEEVNGEFGDNWTLVAVKDATGEDDYYLYVLENIDGEYYIVDHGSESADGFLK